MCGIFGLFNFKGNRIKCRLMCLNQVRKIKHRGPDDETIYEIDSPNNIFHFLAHTRLGIVDPLNGRQPVFDDSEEVVAIVNGEIYNHLEFKGHNDSQVVPKLYAEFGIEKALNMMDGDFATIIYDKKQDRFYVGRDYVGVCPCYIGYGDNNQIIISSELKAMVGIASVVEILLPGHYYDSKENKQIKYYKHEFLNLERVPTTPINVDTLRDLLIKSVQKRLMTDVPFGVLLSGGLDSSLTAAISARLYKSYLSEVEKLDGAVISPKLCSFAVGFKDSKDIVAAKQVADFIGTHHYEILIDIQEGLDAIEEAVYFTESFNYGNIRSCIPMFLMLRKIKSLGLKMILMGEGADEIFGGYLYFHYAPNPKELHQETIRKFQNLHFTELRRGNKITMAWGVEARVPFLDKDFVEYVYSYDPSYKMINKEQGIEKYYLRKAFDDKKNPYLPHDALWRQKEQFSDGVGYSWVDAIEKYIQENFVTDLDMKYSEIRYPIKPPRNKIEYYFRTVFEKHFPNISYANTVPIFSGPCGGTEYITDWKFEFTDSVDESAKSLKIHNYNLEEAN